MTAINSEGSQGERSLRDRRWCRNRGLSAAIALQRSGWNTEVIERATRIDPVGAGLTLQPNAVLALRRLGCSDDVEQVGAHLRFGGLRRADGSPLSVLSAADAERIEETVGAPAIGIHRATLHAALARHVEQLSLASELTAYEDRGDLVRVTTADGKQREADLLIGADGINSRLRASIQNDGAPRYAGYYCWRGVASGDAGLPEGWAASIGAMASGSADVLSTTVARIGLLFRRARLAEPPSSQAPRTACERCIRDSLRG